MARKPKQERPLEEIPAELLRHRQGHPWVFLPPRFLYAEGARHTVGNIVGYTERRECSCGCWVEQDYAVPSNEPLGSPRRHTPDPYRTHGQGRVNRHDARVAWFDAVGGVRGITKGDT